MPTIVGSFEEEVKWLRCLVGDERYGHFDYHGEETFQDIVGKHFKNVQFAKKYGVYIVRCQESNKVIYSGKGGTIGQDGDFKRQDIFGRLTNTRGNKNANETFIDYYKNYGHLPKENKDL